MRKKLITHVNGLFSHAPKTAQAQEIHDEILLNTLDRYDEEIAGGHSEEEAYRVAVESIGSVDEILDSLAPAKSVTTIRRVIAIALYVFCVAPVIIGDAFGNIGAIIGVCAMFFLAAIATYLLLTARLTPATRKTKQLRALGIALYIICVTPTIFFSEAIDGKLGDTLGVCLMFLFAAVATALVVYASAGRRERKKIQEAASPAEVNDVSSEEFSSKSGTSLYWKIFVPVYWVCASGLFFLLGSTVVQWYFAWLVFPIAGALFGIIRAIVHRDGLNSVKQICSALLWLLVILTYFILTLKTEAYFITWLCFPIGAALNGVVSGIFEIKKRRNMK